MMLHSSKCFLLRFRAGNKYLIELLDTRNEDNLSGYQEYYNAYGFALFLVTWVDTKMHMRTHIYAKTMGNKVNAYK